MKVAILTVSDRSARGERADQTGPALAELLRAEGHQVLALEVVPDEADAIQDKLVQYADILRADLVLTNGGTGLAPRDVTPEATAAVIQRQVPGIAEAMRAYGMRTTADAMLSRAIAGARGACLIVNLPGSPRAALESLRAILGCLPHAVEMLAGGQHDCAQRPRAAPLSATVTSY